MKLTLPIRFFSFISASCFGQISTLIDNFKPAYANKDILDYITNSKNQYQLLRPEEKAKGQRILNLFKVLTGSVQDIPIIDFNKYLIITRSQKISLYWIKVLSININNLVNILIRDLGKTDKHNNIIKKKQN
ncbi:hypothetical protein [Pedobacter duraquae]|uniref:Uncharacterized protein n=1 Tax=Pedobacter duraquae TaxID=425511 RepID=A0A4R6ICL6_9SPHI|nr:hypothetical protein [Pedobacter duraquae]TDO19351.1 hypothetical protein CLV32_4591 [Pedobacter duraquae]